VLVQRQRGESNFASQNELGLHAHTAGPSEGRRRSWRRGAGAGHAGVCARHVRGVFHRDPHRRPCRGGRKRVFRGCDGNAGDAPVVGTTGAWSEPRRAVCLYKCPAGAACALQVRIEPPLELDVARMYFGSSVAVSAGASAVGLLSRSHWSGGYDGARSSSTATTPAPSRGPAASSCWSVRSGAITFPAMSSRSEAIRSLRARRTRWIMRVPCTSCTAPCRWTRSGPALGPLTSPSRRRAFRPFNTPWTPAGDTSWCHRPSSLNGGRPSKTEASATFTNARGRMRRGP
jgi:hypothetical protein